MKAKDAKSIVPKKELKMKMNKKDKMKNHKK
jgi:hypothetical protein